MKPIKDGRSLMMQQHLKVKDKKKKNNENILLSSKKRLACCLKLFELINFQTTCFLQGMILGKC
jgi:hypothetical protein